MVKKENTQMAHPYQTNGRKPFFSDQQSEVPEEFRRSSSGMI